MENDPRYEKRIQLQGHGESESDTRYLDIIDYGTNVRLDLFSEGENGVNETFWIDGLVWRQALGPMVIPIFDDDDRTEADLTAEQPFSWE